MSKIIQFKGQDEEQHSCPTCDLVWSYLGEVIDSESPEELFEALSGLVSEAKDLGLKEYLVAELDAKAELLDILEGNCCDCDECCGQCEDED
jgi:hypothetical protein